MYQRTSHHPAIEKLSDSLRQAVLEYEDRAAFVKSVCEAATECRFGRDKETLFVIQDINPQIESAMFYNLLDEAPQPHFMPSPLGRRRKVKNDDDVSATGKREDGLLESAPQAKISSAFLTPNQGRGSP